MSCEVIKKFQELLVDSDQQGREGYIFKGLELLILCQEILKEYFYQRIIYVGCIDRGIFIRMNLYFFFLQIVVKEKRILIYSLLYEVEKQVWVLL